MHSLPSGEVFLRLGKFDVASGQRPIVSFDARIERAVGQFDTFGGPLTIVSHPCSAGRSYASPVFLGTRKI